MDLHDVVLDQDNIASTLKVKGNAMKVAEMRVCLVQERVGPDICEGVSSTKTKCERAFVSSSVHLTWMTIAFRHISIGVSETIDRFQRG